MLQIQAQGRRFEKATEQFVSTKAICVVRSSLCAYTFIHNLRYAEKKDRCNYYEKGLVTDPRLPSVKFLQNEKNTGDQLFDYFRVGLAVTRRTRNSEQLYAFYHKTWFPGSVQPEYIYKHPLSIRKILNR